VRDRDTNTRKQISELTTELEQFRYGYGLGDHAEKIDAMSTAAASCRNRADRLRARADELLVEATSLEEEAHGRERILEAFLIDLLQSVEERHRMWTPAPVLGYRMWAVRSGLLTGVVEPWPTPSLQARCAAGRGKSGLPHSDGRCGRLGCGIYAGKDIGRLLSRPPGLGGPGRLSARSDPSLAIGLVQLSGKVIEHDLGYRAERATVVAVVANHGGRVLVTSEPDGIAALYANPLAEIERSGGGIRQPFLELAVRFLTRQAEERANWTSDNRSE
jgi:hypothetical protein